MARVALYLAVASAHVRCDIVAAEAFPGLARRYSVRSVPTTIVDEVRAIVGAPAADELVQRIVEAAN